MKPIAFLLVFLAFAHRCAWAQNAPPHTLAEFVHSMNWDPGKRGPLMVLEPEAVKGKKDVEELAGFRRTRISLTGLSGIVPSTMVIIDDSMLQPPNMYDGLPRHSKVLYLMTTLNPRQWDAITVSGLGISDLSPDQKAVFTSLLPKPFIYSSFTVATDRHLDPIDKSIELSESDLSLVRLHLERCLRFMMPIIGQQNAMTPRDTKHDNGRPGDKVTMRDWDQQFRPQESFGMKIRQTVPNEQKPSDLNYRMPAFTGSIKLNPSERIADILSRIGQATSLEFHADYRVGDRMMTSIGTSAPIYSVLRMIAMAVTGTYRKVGDAFILTSDLVGMGTRKLKLANYDSELDAKVHNQENVWREQIYKSGRLSQIRYRSDDRLTPGDALMKKLDQGFPGNEAKITATDLTGELRDFVQRQNEIYRTQQVTAEGATAQTEYEYSFVLPNGDSTKSDIDTLGEHIFFASATSEPVSRPQQTSMPKVDLGTIKDPTALCITANTQAEAQHAIDVASLFGFKDVWLDTLSPKVLTVAVKLAASRSIKLSLAVRPFDYRTTTDSASADRTILGDTPPESMKRRMADITWEGISSNGWKSPELLGPISPLSNGYIARQETVANLAKTPGLAGVHILNPTPRGYNGPRVDYMSFPQPLFLEKGNFGYAPDLRLAFIRERNVDPIDLVPPQLYSNSDLRQPFFLDDALRGSSSIYDGSDQPNPATATMMREFDTWLAKLNHRSLQSLLDAISTASPGTAITMEAIPVAMNAVNRVGGGLVDWKPGDTLPEFTELRRGDAAPDLSNYVQRIWVSDTVQVYAHAVLTYMARPDEKRPRMAGIVLDLTNLEPLDADKWLGQTLVRQADKGR